MTIERATKAYDRMETLGAFDFFEEPNRERFRAAMIDRIMKFEEDEVRPDLIELIDMSDLKFKITAPIIKPLLHAAVQANVKVIEREINKNLERMRAATV